MSRNPKNKLREPIPIPEPASLPEPEEIDIQNIYNEYIAGAIDIVVVLGPTASGKTRFAVNLAHQLSGLARGADELDHKGFLANEGDAIQITPAHNGIAAEILSADSRQVYKGMDIGTGKDLNEYVDVPYHLIDIVPAGMRFDLYQWQKAFEKAYEDVRLHGRIPILCGGTGLYIQAATCGYTLPQVPPDEVLRNELELLDKETLIGKLAACGPLPDNGVLQSKRRVIRAIEVAQYEKEHPVQRTAYLPKKPYFIGTLVSREERNARIDRRLDERLQGGMIEEVRSLLDSGIPSEDLVYYGLEYKFVTQYVLGILSYEEMRTLLSNAIHQFAKRQMTWFRGMERRGLHIHWVKPQIEA